MGAGGVIAALQTLHHATQGLNRADNRSGQKKLDEDGDDGHGEDHRPHQGDAPVGLVDFLGFKAYQGGLHFNLDLPRDKIQLIKKHTTRSTQQIGLSRLARRVIDGGIANFRNPAPHERAPLIFAPPPGERRVEGIEIALHGLAHLEAGIPVAWIAAFLPDVSFGIHRLHKGRDGMETFHLNFLGVGRRGVESDAVERHDQVKGEKMSSVMWPKRHHTRRQTMRTWILPVLDPLLLKRGIR